MDAKIQDAQLTILLEIDGVVHLVGMEKEKFDAVSFLVKRAVSVVIPTKKDQGELVDFLEYKQGPPIEPKKA